MKYGFIRVAASVPSVKVADIEYNVEQIDKQILEAERQGVEIIAFPELCITGYTCQDLFTQGHLLKEAENAIGKLVEISNDLDIISIVGVPVPYNNILLNCAAIISHGTLFLIPKTYIPNYGEFYEKRWFASSDDINPGEFVYAGQAVDMDNGNVLFQTSDDVRFGVEICEDVWSPEPVSTPLALCGADIVFNLSASDELIGKHDYLKSLLSQQSARTISGYVYSSCGFGESTQDVVFGGNAIIYENGTLLAEGNRFDFNPQIVISEIDVERLRSERMKNTTFRNAQKDYTSRIWYCGSSSEDNDNNGGNTLAECHDEENAILKYRTIDAHPFIPQSKDMQKSCDEIFNIQIAGLAKRLVHTNSRKVVIGISGGLDSTLALLVCVKTFDKLGYDRKGILGVTMPGFGTTDRTYNNAISLMNGLGISIREINIAKAVTQHFEDIGHDINVHDVTYENSQARERTQILMDLTNHFGGLVVGTGDLSELALGWATYNGDHMSMYGVNASIPKTLIQYMVRYVADSFKQTGDSKTATTLYDIVDTPISPELTPADEQGNIKQKTEDLVGPYELHDFFLYYFLRFGFRPAKLYYMAKKAFMGKYDEDTVKHWLKVFIRRFFSQQFKRSCLPDGPKVGSVSLSPRGDWRMPSDASSHLWLTECDNL